MFEVTIRTENEAALQKLLDFIAFFGFQVVKQKPIAAKPSPKEPAPSEPAETTTLPVDWAEEPDVMALAGIWEGRNIDPDELRKQAWRTRA